MNFPLPEWMREATRLTRKGQLGEAVSLIQRRLAGAPMAPGKPGASKAASRRSPQAKADEDVIDVQARRLAPDTAGQTATGATGGTEACVSPVPAPVLKAGAGNTGTASRKIPVPLAETERDPGEQSGCFTEGEYSHRSIRRRYKLYVPKRNTDQAMPLVVMLHGCKQDPDDFALGTGMNGLADEMGFCVLYPAQAQSANPLRCWNWFKHNHQHRDQGEPAWIASLTREVIEQQGLDADRVYVAGLSAGGAMAAVVAAAYPDIYAAVGVHSGLPGGAATDVMGAMEVMKSGQGQGRRGPLARGKGAGEMGSGSLVVPVPTIVFHGDEDTTVHPLNGEQVIADLMNSAREQGRVEVEQGLSPKGRRYTRSTHHTEAGQALAEHWVVHGAGHAWAGGQANGSYTDAQGPDASREMWRFFMARRLKR